jgi:hypothetical protein
MRGGRGRWTWRDVTAFTNRKIAVIAAHRSSFVFQPELIPTDIT